jgi:hypothetical protein
MVSQFQTQGLAGDPVSYLVFIAFIFLIVVVLMNLLDDLKVSARGSSGKP